MVQKLEMHDYPGALIVLEGIDGCGKSEQARVLSLALQSAGMVTIMSRTPGGSRLGDRIRDILFEDPTTHFMDHDAASLLYLASHLQSYRDVIEPALKDNKIVISDRWDAYSGRAFGIYGPVSESVLNLRQEMSGPSPDLVIFLYGDVTTFYERTHLRHDRHQDGKKWSSIEMLSKIQERYRGILPSDITIRICVDNLTFDSVHDKIMEAVRKSIKI